MPDGHAQRRWSLQDAKARFSALVRDAQAHGPQLVTVHGRDAVVVVSAAEYARLRPVVAPPAQRTLRDVLMDGPFADLDGFDALLAEMRQPNPVWRAPPDFSAE